MTDLPPQSEPTPPASQPPMRPWLRRLFRRFGLAMLLAILLSAVALSDRTVEHTGDNVQLALPLSGLACAVATGQGVKYVGRFVLLFSLYTGSKRGLGEVPLNERPNGGYAGFPSGHTSASTFGATWLASTCLAQSPVAQGVAILAAGFVGGTRIEHGSHNVWQVLAGGFLGWMIQFLPLTWFDRGFRWLCLAAGRGIRTAALSLWALGLTGWRRLRGQRNR